MSYSTSQIRMKLIENDRWLIRGLLAIYEKQTYDEQRCKETKEDNGVGFNSADAKILSKMAEFYKHNKFLSLKQLAITRERMLKYSSQLANIANSKGA